MYGSKMKFESPKHSRCADTDILNKKMYLIHNYLSLKDIYLKDNATMAANSCMSL